MMQSETSNATTTPNDSSTRVSTGAATASEEALAGFSPGETDVFREICSALEGCADFLDLLASLYFKPLSGEQVDNIASLDAWSLHGVNELMDDGLHDVERYLSRRTTATRRDMAVDFTAAFAGTSTWEGRYAVPYESVFTSDEGLLCRDAYHEVYRLYRRNHVERAEGYDYPDDHLSFMFEFMAIMCNRAEKAVREGDCAVAARYLEETRDFLHRHVLSWFDDFRDVSLHLLKTRFYRGVLKTTEGFLAFLDDALGDMAAMLDAEPAHASKIALS